MLIVRSDRAIARNGSREIHGAEQSLLNRLNMFPVLQLFAFCKSDHCAAGRARPADGAEPWPDVCSRAYEVGDVGRPCDAAGGACAVEVLLQDTGRIREFG